MVPLTAIAWKRWTPYLLLVALTVVTASALLPLARFYYLDDSLLHLFRLTEFDRLVGQGIWYPRWAPDFAYGYGYPVFNFYPPLAYYIIEVIHLLGPGIPVAMTLASIGMVGFAMLGAYELGVELFRAAPRPSACGLLTAVAYGFFPYLLLDPFQRGALPETLGAAMLPWSLWAIHRLLTRRSVGAMLLAAFSFAAFVLAHNLTAFFAAPLLLAFALLLPATGIQVRVRGWLFLAGAVALGGMLTAIYSLPSLLELPLVAGSRATKALATLFDVSFMQWPGVIQWSLPYEYHEQPFPISALPLVLSAIALVLALVTKAKPVRRILVFFAVVVVLLIPLLLDASRPFWLGVPLLSSFQFPWRISTFIGLSTAILIGALPMLLARMEESAFKWVYRVALLLVSLLLMWNGLAGLAPKPLTNPTQDLTLGQIARSEQNLGGLGFGWLSEYLPLTVKALPVRMETPAQRKDTPRVTLSEYSATRRLMTVDAAGDVTLSLRQFFFPGWQARIDGKPVATFPTTALGLLSMTVPAGKHTVDITWQDTPARQAGEMLSAAGLVIALGLVAVALRRRDHVVGIVTIVGAVLFMVLVFASPVLAAKPAVIQKIESDVGSDLRVIGVTVQNATYDGEWRIPEARDALDVTMYWQVKKSISQPEFTWRIVDQTGRVWSEERYNSRYGTGFPGAWVPDEIVQDEYTLALPPSLPAGNYRFQVGVSNEFVPVAEFSLARGTATAPQPPAMTTVDAQFGDNIRLLGFNAPRTAKPNDSVPIALYWQAQHSILEDFTVFVHLVDNQGNLVAQQDGLTQDSFFPTSLWLPGRIVPDNYRVAIPKLNPGAYRWVVGLYRLVTMERLPVRSKDGAAPDDEMVIGDLKIPMNVTATPSNPLPAQFGSNIRLAGYDLNVRNYGAAQPLRAGQDLGLTLYWKADAPINTDYKVFIHVVDAAGNIVAQDDALPGRNTYPTRIWDPGEMVLDAHSLTLPAVPGHYRIFAGMYDATSGERLPAVMGGSELPNKEIELQALDVE